mmetsp:Transcript_40965/g.49717  ORF Transcript_40965/g.49717 Transcript_40965/m.49717 type:complete len:240 (+) Transcript_40965:156-875(+)
MLSESLIFSPSSNAGIPMYGQVEQRYASPSPQLPQADCGLLICSMVRFVLFRSTLIASEAGAGLLGAGLLGSSSFMAPSARPQVQFLHAFLPCAPTSQSSFAAAAEDLISCVSSRRSSSSIISPSSSSSTASFHAAATSFLFVTSSTLGAFFLLPPSLKDILAPTWNCTFSATITLKVSPSLSTEAFTDGSVHPAISKSRDATLFTRQDAACCTTSAPPGCRSFTRSPRFAWLCDLFEK